MFGLRLPSMFVRFRSSAADDVSKKGLNVMLARGNAVRHGKANFRILLSEIWWHCRRTPKEGFTPAYYNNGPTARWPRSGAFLINVFLHVRDSSHRRLWPHPANVSQYTSPRTLWQLMMRRRGSLCIYWPQCQASSLEAMCVSSLIISRPTGGCSFVERTFVTGIT